MTGLIAARRFPHGRAVALFGGAGVSPVTLFSDDFTRADSATTLGAGWTAITGTWGIASNQAYNPSATANAYAVVDAGTADCTVYATMSAIATQSGIYVRSTDGDNWIRLIRNSTSLILQKSVAGTLSTVATLATGLTFHSGDVFRLTMSGQSFSAYLNGQPQGAAQTINDFETVTTHGIGIAAGVATARWDNFKVTTP